MKAVVTSRRPFPSSNPWQYQPSDEEDLTFAMIPTLLIISVSCAYLGWSLAKPIPLVPNWLVALAAAGGGAYAATLQDTLGDLLRLYGHTLHQGLSEMLYTADEVHLRTTTAVLVGRVLFFLKGVDSQYHVVSKLQFLLAQFIAYVTMLVYRMRGMETAQPMRRGGGGGRRREEEVPLRWQ